MAIRYTVLGAGMQGQAAAYDFVRFGNAESVCLADINLAAAEQAAQKINDLLKTSIVCAEQLDIKDIEQVKVRFRQSDVCLSAVPYFFNYKLTEAAIEAGCHFCDLGGNTDVVFKQHELTKSAEEAGVTVLPDCGLAPGMANILAAHGIAKIEQPRKALIRVGGLPQNPQPPLGYHLFFSMEGLTNEYFGKAHVLKNNQRVEVDTFTELEDIEFPEPFGKCEAFMTAGGTSTCPWTFEGKLEEYDEKTIRYPGHYEQMKTIHELGLLGLDTVDVNGQQVVPRQLFHAVVEPLLKVGDPKDVVLLRITVSGEKEKMVMELIDTFDDATGFSAMQRTTGWGASIVAIMMAEGDFQPGCLRLEEAVNTNKYLQQMQKRGFDLKITS